MGTRNKKITHKNLIVVKLQTKVNNLLNLIKLQKTIMKNPIN